MNPSFTIRPFRKTAEDYAAVVDILNAAFPDAPTSVAEVKHRVDAWDAAYWHERALVEIKGGGDDGRSVALGVWGEPSWSFRPGKYFVSLDVHPNFADHGIEQALYEHMLNTINERETPPTLLTTGAREDQTRLVAFWEAHGFECVMRWPRSVLQLATFDSAPFAGLPQKVAAAGIRILPLSELCAIDDDWQRKLYELDWACLQDEPQPDAPTRIPFEQFIKYSFEEPGFVPQGYFVALDGSDYVGLSVLSRRLADPQRFDTNFTAVLRSHRRRGIATAMKLRAIESARALGAAEIVTGNEENNPMYQINLRLGFEPKPGWLAYHKTLGDAQDASAPSVTNQENSYEHSTL